MATKSFAFKMWSVLALVVLGVAFLVSENVAHVSKLQSIQALASQSIRSPSRVNFAIDFEGFEEARHFSILLQLMEKYVVFTTRSAAGGQPITQRAERLRGDECRERKMNDIRYNSGAGGITHCIGFVVSNRPMAALVVRPFVVERKDISGTEVLERFEGKESILNRIICGPWGGTWPDLYQSCKPSRFFNGDRAVPYPTGLIETLDPSLAGPSNR